MNYGMLWFDNDPKVALPEKVQKAAAYYRNKYGAAPDLCLVNPAMLGKDRPKIEKIEVETATDIQPNHFWVGQREV